MRKEFFVSRLLSVSHLVLGLIFVPWAVIQLAGTPTSWRVLIGILFLITGGWNLYTWRLMSRSPVIAITEEALEVRAPLVRRAGRIPRGEVTGMAWSNPGAVGLQLRSGSTAAIQLIGLARRDKQAVRDLLAAWAAKAQV